MHAISSYRGNRPTKSHPQTHKQDRLQYTTPQLPSMQCKYLTKLHTYITVSVSTMSNCDNITLISIFYNNNNNNSLNYIQGLRWTGTPFPGQPFLQFDVPWPQRMLFQWKRKFPGRKDSFIHYH